MPFLPVLSQAQAIGAKPGIAIKGGSFPIQRNSLPLWNPPCSGRRTPFRIPSFPGTVKQGGLA